ncbi:type II toxin-antitoxin system VapC family toxin [Longimicrobium sp.]|uniref:type II toxin-antitoxin system VapC family toxin n=1 Tax=Longimicrobium sp. TaxID=2029185 RepID=UPI002E2EC78A|nr:type II toxin-antitoxin system VapC family toxin [Longimicrobium sp.]HEX6038747.1 type II toxin-antitoxin system VapC family toxin [Longimicrobium sp.]
MDLIVDTSAILAILLEEPSKPRLLEITRDADIAAPASIDWEIGNAIALLFKRKRLTLEQALLVLEAYEQVPIRRLGVRLQKAVSIAHQLDIYAYDAYMLAAAVDQRLPLLTLDQRLARVAPQVGVEIVEVPE